MNITDELLDRSMSEPVRRAVIGIGVLVLIGGAIGVAASSGQSFTEPRGAQVLELMHLNPLGSWVSVGLGVLTVAAGAVRSRALALVAAAGFLVCVALVTVGANRPTNLLGGTASTVGFHLGPAAGLLALTLAERAAVEASGADPDPRQGAGDRRGGR